MTKYESHNGLTLKEISPHDWPVRVGELTILLSHKVGYCAIVVGVSRQNQIAGVRLLDWTHEDTTLEIPLYDCVPTRKTPQGLIEMYRPNSVDFSQALTAERSFPDFDSPALSKSRRTSTKKKKTPPLEGAALVAALALLTPEQKLAIGKLVKKNREKETKG
jgi:hypothetical protein